MKHEIVTVCGNCGYVLYTKESAIKVARVSHGLGHICAVKLYPEFVKK